MMNIIRMTGGLGNQMFQYALFLKYKSLGVECKFDDFTEYDGRDNARPIVLKEAFGIEYPAATKEEYTRFTDSYMDMYHRIIRKIRGRKSHEYKEASLEYDESVLMKNDAYLTGFFQTDKYFDDIKDEVFKAFTFTDEVCNRANEISNEMPAGDNLVSIHLRRGDYVELAQMYGGICTDRYYDEAIDYIFSKTENPEFIVFSNDTVWAREWIKNRRNNSSFYVFEGTKEDNGYIDMYMMSRCHHHIIANSSFSWWGAYLANKYYQDAIKIAPSRWNNYDDRKDIYTLDMIKMK